MRLARIFALLCFIVLAAPVTTGHAAGNEMVIPVSRSELIVLPVDMAEVIVADPSIADVYVHGAKRVSIIGKKIGRTNVRIFDKDNNVVRGFDVVVGYDIPAIRRTLKNFFPHENIGVENVNNGIALTGMVSNAGVTKNALKIVNEFIYPAGTAVPAGNKTGLINLLQVNTGQQVMLRVRVGEMQRTALKRLGVGLNGENVGDGGFSFATGGGGDPVTGSLANVFGTLSGNLTEGGTSLSARIDALESNGLFKVLAEPNLVSLSGEKAEFLAGGEFPFPVAQDNKTVTAEFKPFGVSVQFIPYVLSENRIRISVMPEVSELTNDAQNIQFNGFTLPSLITRRANTTVELSPGESFMIAGLLKDNLSTNINQIPGVGEIPVLSALLRSTAYQRNETELVIAVTPYLVDPLVNSDVKLPTDNFRPASVMESFFYGALGSLTGDARRISQTPSVEGPIGFMVD